MRRLLLTACTLLMAWSVDAAAASRESVDALFAALDMQKFWNASLPEVEAALGAFADGPSAASMTSAQRHRVDLASARLMHLLETEMSWQALGPDIAQMYADVFTQDEIDGLLAFYGSAAARSMQAKSPALLGKAMQGIDVMHDDTFTQDEIDAYARFRESPAGRSMLAKNALVAERMQQIGQAHLRRIQPQVMELMQQIAHPDDGEPGAASKP